MELQIMAGGGTSPVLNPLCFLDHLQKLFVWMWLMYSPLAILEKSDPDPQTALKPRPGLLE